MIDAPLNSSFTHDAESVPLLSVLSIRVQGSDVAIVHMSAAQLGGTATCSLPCMPGPAPVSTIHLSSSDPNLLAWADSARRAAELPPVLTSRQSAHIYSDWCVLQPRRVLVVYNPVSGTGSSAAVVEGIVVPVLLAADCTVDVRRTERPGHARELARLEQTPVPDVIFCCGGDGLVSEVRLLAARDVSQHRQVVNGNVAGRRRPVAVAPAGTDNCLAATLGITSVPLACLVAVKVRCSHARCASPLPGRGAADRSVQCARAGCRWTAGAGAELRHLLCCLGPVCRRDQR